MKHIHIQLISLLGLFLFSTQVSASCKDKEDSVIANNLCSVIETYQSSALSESPTLAVVIHGDAPFNQPAYHYRVAKLLAKKAQNVIAVGLLRPGYTDDFNRTSDGIRGETVGDNYDDDRIKHMAGAIDVLQQKHKARKVVVIGHSGGAAITAKLIALYPELVDHAVVVSCPCNINVWRKHMLKRNEYELFKGDLDISSPVDLVASIAPSARIDLIIGSKDDVTLPTLTEEYFQLLKKHGKNVKLYTIEGRHNILQKQPAIDVILEALN